MQTGLAPSIHNEVLIMSKEQKFFSLWLHATLGDTEAQFQLGQYYSTNKVGEGKSYKALRWYKKAAEKDHKEAQLALGNCYFNGNGTDQNYSEAYKWYQLAAQWSSNKEARFRLGYCLFYGLGVNADYTEAFNWFDRASGGFSDGHPEAQFYLGLCYAKGLGTEPDLNQAVKYFSRAAEQGNEAAKHYIGGCYAVDSGNFNNIEDAVSWYKDISSSDNAEDLFKIGIMFLNSRRIFQKYGNTEALNWFIESGLRGYLDAQLRCAVIYDFGQYKIKPDIQKAIGWYKKAAEQDHTGAMKILGELYYEGKKVNQDYKQAVEWFKKGAELGGPGCQIYLGDCYFYGNGVEKDYSIALEWYKKARENGVDSANDMIAKITSKNRSNRSNSISSKRSKANLIEEEIKELVRLFRREGFTESSEISNYIAQNQLGYKFPNIAGHLTMTDGSSSWDFDGGISPQYYAEICNRLGIGNNRHTQSWVEDFESYGNSD